MTPIPPLADLPAKPRAIILHWTAGSGDPSAHDLKHYHFLVAQSGEVHPGVPVERNMRSLQAGDDYAAHTGGMNSFSVGVALCGMNGAIQGETDGPHPITEDQTDAACEFVAELCDAWGLPVTPRTVFTHAEAWTLHDVKGTRNDQKWDILHLPWAPNMEAHDIGPYLRELVRGFRTRPNLADIPEPDVHRPERPPWPTDVAPASREGFRAHLRRRGIEDRILPDVERAVREWLLELRPYLPWWAILGAKVLSWAAGIIGGAEST